MTKRWRIARRFFQGNLIVALIAVGAAPFATELEPPRPPLPPESGPGGRASLFPSVETIRVGELPTGAWVFVPADESGNMASETSLPVVIFFHGFTAVDPGRYLAWLHHLARGGAIVIFPDYQVAGLPSADTDPAAYFPQAVIGIEAALERLNDGDTPNPDLRRVAVTGHSLGGVLATNYTVAAASLGLPAPRVLMPVVPGGCRDCGGWGEQLAAPLRTGLPLADDLHAIVIVAAEDVIVADGGAKRIWEILEAVPLDQRDYVVVQTDTHGEPPLIADHLLPQTGGVGGVMSALDWYGHWKLFDALMACAFDNVWCDVALNGGPEQRFMGVWSDGQPVVELEVTKNPDDLAPIPRLPLTDPFLPGAPDAHHL